MPRLFVNRDQLPVVTGSDVHYLKDVLRLKPQDKLEVLDGSGTVYQAVIKEINSDKVLLDIMSAQPSVTESPLKITLGQCLPKGKKMDLIIQKSTELGVSQIIPVLSERTISRGEKLERWHKIAKEAAEQSGRTVIPEISTPTIFTDLIKQRQHFDLAFIPWELETSLTLKKYLASKPAAKATSLLFLIGPEGGFSKTEIEQAVAAGFTTLSLGRRILRTETAALVVLSMLMYETEL